MCRCGMPPGINSLDGPNELRTVLVAGLGKMRWATRGRLKVLIELTFGSRREFSRMVLETKHAFILLVHTLYNS